MAQNPPRPIPHDNPTIPRPGGRPGVTVPVGQHPAGNGGGGGGHPLSHTQQDAFDLMRETLASWGLSSLTGELRKLIVHGDTSPDTLALALSQTKEYKERFKGNELRVKAGLSELNPAQYIALEEQYHNVMEAYGLPKGLFDSHEDFVKLIGGDVSPDELKERAQVAHDQYMAAPEYVRNLWEQYYGTKGDALAHILDPKLATQKILDQAQQVAIGGTAAQYGIAVDHDRARQFQRAGVTLADAQRAFQQISSSQALDQQIAQRFGGQSFDLNDEENDLLLNDQKAYAKRLEIYGSERGLFRGGSGADQNSLSANQNF